MQGRSFLPLLAPRRHADQKVDWPTETFVQISEAQIGRAVRTHRWKYGVDAPQSMRDHYLEPIGSASLQYQEQYLYDLQTVTLMPPCVSCLRIVAERVLRYA